MKHGARKKRVIRHVAALRLVDQYFRDRPENLIELGPHGVFELQATRAFLQLHRFIIGQVDRDGLRAGVAVAGVINDVVSVQVRVTAWRFLLVRIGHRQPRLQLGQ